MVNKKREQNQLALLYDQCTAAGAKRKSQKQLVDDATGLCFPWLPDALNMISAWRLAIRRKQARPKQRQPKKFDVHVGTGSFEEVEKAKALDLGSELFRPLKLSFPSRAAIFAAARAGKRAGKLLVVARGTTPEKVIEMPGMMKLSKKQPKPKRGRAVAWGIGVPKRKRYVIRRPGLPAVTVTMKEPAGWPRGKSRPRQEPGIKELQIIHSWAACFQKMGVTKRQGRIAMVLLEHLVRRQAQEQQWQTKKKRAGGHRQCAPQRATARKFHISEACISQTLDAVDKKMRKHWPHFSIRRYGLPSRSPH